MKNRIGFGRKITSATRPTRPTAQSAGWSAAAARPPSSGTTGSRLKRLIRKPTNAIALRKFES